VFSLACLLLQHNARKGERAREREVSERKISQGAILPDIGDGQIGWLRQELMSMDTTQRRAFVKFVTASVCMPVEANPIVVYPQVCSCVSMSRSLARSV
jgi:hypothetical protein